MDDIDTAFLDDLNACAGDALDGLEANDFAKCRTGLKALLDAIRERIDGAEAGEG